MKERAASQRRLAPPSTYLDALFLNLHAILIFPAMLLLPSLTVESSDKPSAEIVCFASARRSPGTPLRTAALHQLWDARGKPSVSRSPLAATQRRRLRVFAPGSLSARGRATARAFPSALLFIPK